MDALEDDSTDHLWQWELRDLKASMQALLCKQPLLCLAVLATGGSVSMAPALIQL